ncbi:family 10 glycosylhydrolase [Sphaerisporangium sp. TRM90804]|uniref:family 10 glycosylhydrolase n=1 Tax=Sphaerisporangium sp. TRM90804 TaxID=3031113 RepID=UPI002447F745|nr:family 10 glycosylhydrolase [Sphaerisporangium sp. TRM90804]MDH2428327.1 family 10 glycosylhydrolase [Sphaerisporangium sp. TRM90804]
MTPHRAGRPPRPPVTPGRVAVAVLALLLTVLAPAPAAGASAAPSPAGVTAAASASAACATDPATPKRQLRAMWIASVANVDWPSRTGLSAAAQQAEFRSWLDLAVQKRMNAVIVQVRPTADAFWPSPYEPWSHWLTGTQGTSPGYDPMAFMVAEAHARNLELHAWFNPYRVANHADPDQLVASHPARRNPGWRFAYGGKLYYNPGIPAVRAFIQDAIMDAVTRYDVDGVHMDDYFYPYPVSGETIPDAAAHAQYGSGFPSVHDWRRDNVNRLVRELDQRVHAAKPWVRFGVSPFGIWRNAATDPLGSQTSGLQSYDAIYADTRLWVKQGWVDYIAPQIYWHIGFATADYQVLTAWWAGTVANTGVQLLVGQAAYRAGASGQDAAWQRTAELSDHLTYNRRHPEVAGDVFFSAKDVRADRIGAMTRTVTDHYSRPALVPAYGTGTAPSAPAITSATRGSGGVTLSWQRGGSGSSVSYALYRVDGTPASDPCFFADARNLVTTTRGTTFTDSTAAAGRAYTYYTTALDRAQNESAPSAGRAVAAGTGGFSVVVDNRDPGFTAGSAWGTSSFSAQRHGTDYRFASPVAASDPAWFRATLPSAGSYRVEVWYPADPGYNSATPFLVAATGGNQSVAVDQRTGGGQWRTLGTFTLPAGTVNVVGVSRWTSAAGYVVADAARITRV